MFDGQASAGEHDHQVVWTVGACLLWRVTHFFKKSLPLKWGSTVKRTLETDNRRQCRDTFHVRMQSPLFHVRMQNPLFQVVLERDELEPKWLRNPAVNSDSPRPPSWGWVAGWVGD